MRGPSKQLSPRFSQGLGAEVSSCEDDVASGTSSGRFQNKENCNPIAIGIRREFILYTAVLAPTGFSGLIGFSRNPQSQKEKVCARRATREKTAGGWAQDQSSEEGRPDLLEQKEREAKPGKASWRRINITLGLDKLGSGIL